MEPGVGLRLKVPSCIVMFVDARLYSGPIISPTDVGSGAWTATQQTAFIIGIQSQNTNYIPFRRGQLLGRRSFRRLNGREACGRNRRFCRKTRVAAKLLLVSLVCFCPPIRSQRHNKHEESVNLLIRSDAPAKSGRPNHKKYISTTPIRPPWR